MTKYHNKRTNGYASKKEATRATDLQTLAQAGIITELKEQPRFTLVPAQDGERPIVYVADFSYTDDRGKFVVEDTKGFKTREYIIKRKLFQHKFGFKITEI